VRAALASQFGIRWKHYIRAKFRGIADLKFAPALNAILRSANIQRVVDLAVKTEPELLKLTGMTPQFTDEIKAKLKEAGISLGTPRIEAIIKMSSRS
jgi:DNA-directed RNA polymerase alpha subunit